MSAILCVHHMIYYTTPVNYFNQAVLLFVGLSVTMPPTPKGGDIE